MNTCGAQIKNNSGDHCFSDFPTSLAKQDGVMEIMFRLPHWTVIKTGMFLSSTIREHNLGIIQTRVPTVPVTICRAPRAHTYFRGLFEPSPPLLRRPVIDSAKLDATVGEPGVALDVKLIGNVFFFVRQNCATNKSVFFLLNFHSILFGLAQPSSPDPAIRNPASHFFTKSDLAPLPLGPLKRTSGRLGNIQL